LILIGPEGDFSENEVRIATEKGFRVITLGESRLRTETAALVACTIANVQSAFNKL
jgi:16S rRNA (uracil1498-N3)-methyltransferase